MLMQNCCLALLGNNGTFGCLFTDNYILQGCCALHALFFNIDVVNLSDFSKQATYFSPRTWSSCILQVNPEMFGTVFICPFYVSRKRQVEAGQSAWLRACIIRTPEILLCASEGSQAWSQQQMCQQHLAGKTRAHFAFCFWILIVTISCN